MPRNRSSARFVSSNWFEKSATGPLTAACSAIALDTAAGAPVVVVSYTFWRNRLGSDPNAVGSIVYIDRKPVTIAGVAVAALPGLDFNVPDMFLPITQREYFYPQSTLLRSWSDEAVDMYARLARRVRRRCARGAADDHAGRSAEHAEVKNDEWLEPLLATHNFMRDSERQAVLAVISLLGALTTLVLIVAAANLGNLVMSRAHRAGARARRAHGARRAPDTNRSTARHRIRAARRDGRARQSRLCMGGGDVIAALAAFLPTWISASSGER
jgi:hypothetical protein